MSPSDDYIEATPHVKWVLFALLILILIIGLYSYHEHETIAALEITTEGDLERRIARLHELISYLTIFGFVVGLATSPYFLWLGYRTLKHGKYPPPGSHVVFRTRVVRGKKAVVNAVSLFILALFMWVGFALGLWIDYLVTQLL